MSPYGTRGNMIIASYGRIKLFFLKMVAGNSFTAPAYTATRIDEEDKLL